MSSDMIWRRYSPVAMDDIWYDREDNEVGRGLLAPDGYRCLANTVTVAERVTLEAAEPLGLKPGCAVRGRIVPVPGEDFASARLDDVGFVHVRSVRRTLPTDSAERKKYPLFRGVVRYFPAALAGVARVSKIGNDKHTPGEELHHARGKSSDHADCIIRHLMDLDGLLAEKREPHDDAHTVEILEEASYLAWRALALSQELHERFGAPLAPGAKLSSTTEGVK